MIRLLDLFSGIGGFSLGLERTGGFETVDVTMADYSLEGIPAELPTGVTAFKLTNEGNELAYDFFHWGQQLGHVQA